MYDYSLPAKWGIGRESPLLSDILPDILTLQFSNSISSTKTTWRKATNRQGQAFQDFNLLLSILQQRIHWQWHQLLHFQMNQFNYFKGRLRHHTCPSKWSNEKKEMELECETILLPSLNLLKCMLTSVYTQNCSARNGHADDFQNLWLLYCIFPTILHFPLDSMHFQCTMHSVSPTLSWHLQVQLLEVPHLN